MNYRKNENTELVNSVMEENKTRLKELSLKRDQFSGKGVAGHTVRLELDGYPIHTQYLTEEVANNQLYRLAREEGSVNKLRLRLIEMMERGNENEGLRNENENENEELRNENENENENNTQPVAERTRNENENEGNTQPVAERTGEEGTAGRTEGMTELTEEDVVNLLFITRCRRDPSFAFYTCFYIKHKKTGKDVPFRLNYAQHKVLELLEDMRYKKLPIRLILLKARQWGGSTLSQLYMAWIQLFVKEGWNSVVIAQTKDTAKRIKAMYKKVLENFPGWIFGSNEVEFAPHMGSSNDSILTDGKGGVLRRNVITVASYENFESTRGADFALAHFSETAYWATTKGKKAEDVITNIEGNILEEPLTLEINESTAKGMSGYFHDEYQLAKKGKSSRRALFVPFFWIENDMKSFVSAQQKRHFAEWLVENRNNEVAPDEAHESGQYLYSLWTKGASLEHINWYVKKREGLHSHEQMAQEAPSDDYECFAFSGFRIFSIEQIETEREEHCKEPMWVGEISYYNENENENENNAQLMAERTEREVDIDEAVRERNKRQSGKPILTKGENGRLKIWKQPDKLKTKNQYLVVVDVGGKGDKSDYSVITVINRLGKRVPGGKLEVVARWRGHIRYDRLAWIAVAVARYYKNALLVIESNTMDKRDAEANEYIEQGDHIRGILDEIGRHYRNLYKRKATDPESIKKGVKTKYGFNTNVKTKQDMVDYFIKVFEDCELIEHDAIFYEEASIYEQRPNGSYGNIVGKDNHDDVLMTDMIGCLVEKDMERMEVIS